MVPTATAASLTEEIDQLLEHYLYLLDQYTILRSQLAESQSSVYLNLSRANFTAERGIRYGADFYDTRMQASRVCCITVPATNSTTTVGSLAQQEKDAVDDQTLDDADRDTTASSTLAEAISIKEKERPKVLNTPYFTVSKGPTGGLPESNKDAAGEESGKEKTKTARDPLRMFGLLTPPALREAQARSYKTVEEIVPKLVSIDTQMKDVEIRIRRARKWKAKAEARESTINEKDVSEAEQRREVLA